MKYTRNEDAVSPVIGVILMVAITVILAAVIAAFVFGMAGIISKTKVVVALVQQPDANSIVLTCQGGQDAVSCTRIRWDITPAGGTLTSTTMVPESGYTFIEVGKSITITGTFAGRGPCNRNCQFL